MVPNTEFVFEKQRTAATAQLSFADHCFSVRQDIGFVHKVCRQQDDFAVSSRLQERPHLSSRVRIHARGWLVQNNYLRISYDCYPN